MSPGIKAVLVFWAIMLALAVWVIAVCYCVLLNQPFVGIPLLIAPLATLITSIVYVDGQKND